MMDFSDTRRAAFKRLMQDRGLNSASLSRLSGVPESTLRTYLSGKKTVSLNARNERKIAQALNLSVPALYGEDYDSPTVKEVWVKGLVGAGARIKLWSPGMGEGEGYSRVPWPPGVPMTEDLIAFEIRGESMPPYNDGDLVFLEQSDALPGPELHGKLCVVELDSGELLIKTVRRGYTEGRFNLHSTDGRPPIEDARVVKAQRVRAIVLK